MLVLQWCTASHRSIEKYWILNGKYLIRIYENIDVSFSNRIVTLLPQSSQFIFKCLPFLINNFYVRKFTICHWYEIWITEYGSVWPRKVVVICKANSYSSSGVFITSENQTNSSAILLQFCGPNGATKAENYENYGDLWNTSKSFSLEFE